jgi:hypothetical protein
MQKACAMIQVQVRAERKKFPTGLGFDVTMNSSSFAETLFVLSPGANVVPRPVSSFTCGLE